MRRVSRLSLGADRGCATMADARETVDRYYSSRLGLSVADLTSGQVAVTTSFRRTVAERGNDARRPLWIIDLGGRVAVSVHPAALA
jgi:hypothetical protein